MMQHASAEDQPNLLTLFKQHKNIFPYLRVDYLTRKIDAGTVIWDGGVVMIYNIYKVTRPLGNVRILKGDMMLSEMATKTPGSGSAGVVLEQFLKEFQTTVWLTVRADNGRACAFYEKHHMHRVGLISWAKGTIPGYIYCRPWCSPLDILSKV